MKTAIVCNTPLQVMNALNIVINDVECCKNDCDLYLIMNFRDSDRIADRVETTELFRHVFRFRSTGEKITSFIDLLSSRKILSTYEFSDRSFMDMRYDNLFVSDRNLLGVALNYISRCRNVYVFDDGIATYSGNSISDPSNYRYPFLNRLFRSDDLSYKIRKLFVNNKEFCRSQISEQLPLLGKKNPVFEVLMRVFDFNVSSEIATKKVIVLEQPLDKKENYNQKKFKEILDEASVDTSDTLVRLHPVQKDIEYGDYRIDHINNLWELECIKSISNEHTLISFYSSAQFSPKLIAGKEPYVVFLYKLFLSRYDSRECQMFEKMVNEFKESYEDDGKIFVPENIDELKEIIKKRG